MLTPAQKQRIAEEAAHTTRLDWGDVSPRSLGELAATLTHRAAEGTLGIPTFSEYADARVRRQHAERVHQRDAALDALLDHEPELRKALGLIAERQGAEGVVSFACDHGLPLAECERILEEEGWSLAQEADRAAALGD